MPSCHLETILGPFWVLGSFWDHFGTILGSFWKSQNKGPYILPLTSVGLRSKPWDMGPKYGPLIWNKSPKYVIWNMGPKCPGHL